MTNRLTDPQSLVAKWAGRHADKEALRHEIWAKLEQASAAVGNPWHRIPVFVGGEDAAARLVELPIWINARVLNCSPDTAQAPVRRRALEAGKLIYMPVPALTHDDPFVLLDPQALQAQGVSPAEASFHARAVEVGQKVRFEDMLPMDLVVTGCVAVTRQGGRTGKGAGFADLEFGVLREYGLMTTATPIVTTVHPFQVVPNDRVIMQPHDSALHWIITPDEVIETHSPFPQPSGIDWERVQPDQYQDIPFLKHLREQRHRSSNSQD